MKVHMCDWFRNCKGLPVWFKHGEIADITWEQIKDLHDAGISLLIKKWQDKDGETSDIIILVAVSNGGFGQMG